jgi:hypothetical protein
MFNYSGKILFTSDQELTPTQLNQLLDLLYLQIVEPVDENQNDETYSTSAQIVTLDKDGQLMNEKMSFAEFLNSIQPFTVGQMKEALAGLSDETQILFGVPVGTDLNSDWFNVSQNYHRPDTDEEYLALTFFLSDNYDSRQF